MKQQTKQIDDAIVGAQNETLQCQADENGIDLGEFDSILQPIIDSCTKDSISAGKNWILQHTTDPAKSNVVLQCLLKKALMNGSTFSQKLHLIYLVNDILHHCVRKNANDLKNNLENVVIPMFCSAELLAKDEQRAKLTKLLSLWEGKAKFFDACVISKLRSPESSMQEYKTNLMNLHNNIIQQFTKSTKNTFENYQQQHTVFIQHANSQIQLLEQQGIILEQQLTQARTSFQQQQKLMQQQQQQLKQQQQQQQQQVVIPPVVPTQKAHPPSLLSQTIPMPTDDDGPTYIGQNPNPFNQSLNMGPSNNNPFGSNSQPQKTNPFASLPQPPQNNNNNPFVNQPQMQQQQPPLMDYQNLMGRVEPPIQPQPLMDFTSLISGRGGDSGADYQSPPPSFLIPDMSRPPPNFLTGDGPVPGQAPIIEDQKPTAPYYDLPAGLMIPLIHLEDYNYKPLYPEDIRLPPPTPQNERLVNALTAFYSAPSHDRPRDNEGWEKLALYEYYKAKNSARKDKEDAIMNGEREKSRSPSPVKMEVLKPKKANKRCYRSKSRSRSRSPKAVRPRSKTPPMRSRSRSPSPSPRIDNRNNRFQPQRGRSPRRSPPRPRRDIRDNSRETPAFKRDKSASPPPSFFGGNYPKPNEFIEETNKGHQMLMKMGWGGAGAGLGSNNQGIDTPISSGEARDRQDMYKGVGVNLNDPFENFRKNKGAAFIHRIRSRAEDKS
ncbi:CHERP family protein [Megaselia abdita]